MFTTARLTTRLTTPRPHVSSGHSNAHRRRRLLALLTAAALLLAACGDDADSASSDSGGDDTSFDQAAQPAAEFDGDGDAGETETPDEAPREDADFDSDDQTADSVTTETDTSSDGEVANQVSGADFALPAAISGLAVGRQIIFTGDVVVESNDVAQATDDVIDAVFANGGVVWGQDTRTDPKPETVLTIRVPPADFNRVLDAISGTATLVSQTISTDDVTEVVVDLDARIIASESSVARVQTLLDAADDLNTVFTLEEELATRQAQLERLRGQRKTIGDQVTLATITLTIIELDPDRLTPEMEVVAWLGDDVDDACPGVSDLSIGADDSAVLCVNVSNTGEDTLTDIDIQSTTLRLRIDDFQVSQSGTGSLESLAPGEELLVHAALDAEDGFIYRVDASDGVTIGVSVTSNPETSPSVELVGDDAVFISADVDDPLPGFGESFSGGLGAMIAVLSLLMIAVGVLLPFLPFIALAVWLGRRAIIKSRERADARAAYADADVASVSEPQPPSQPSPPPAG